MREILFRGKLTSGKGWSYGNLVVNTQGVTIITPDKSLIGKYGQVDPETVGQFTGLTDKNDKRIFEGDILGFHTQSDILVNLCVVSWDDRDACWTLKMKTMSPRFFMHNPKAVEIIGNIHDNPELLEDTK